MKFTTISLPESLLEAAIPDLRQKEDRDRRKAVNDYVGQALRFYQWAAPQLQQLISQLDERYHDSETIYEQGDDPAMAALAGMDAIVCTQATLRAILGAVEPAPAA